MWRSSFLLLTALAVQRMWIDVDISLLDLFLFQSVYWNRGFVSRCACLNPYDYLGPLSQFVWWRQRGRDDDWTERKGQDSGGHGMQDRWKERKWAFYLLSYHGGGKRGVGPACEYLLWKIVYFALYKRSEATDSLLIATIQKMIWGLHARSNVQETSGRSSTSILFLILEYHIDIWRSKNNR